MSHQDSHEPHGLFNLPDASSIKSVPSNSTSENLMRNTSSDESPADGSHSSTSTPLILYEPPTALSILRGAAINLLLPFMNGLMLGFGELFAHEVAYRLGWSNTRVLPAWRRSRPIGPGVEVQESSRPRRTWGAGL